ncbi:hypothetical protein SAMN05421823_102140 [Catalinimonas alkaloidigena]|uniref:Uncharacterized protein n=2 Tax=Catalinimonas alkaloidigena TaxID=1075417 RepID=A0A1G9A041_9BACT|nr:hypothetical protein SAMN05421823_102140 [Catalinimonas alkaloidigena]
MTRIEDFWRVDDLIKERYGTKWYNHVDYCGLIPVRPLQNLNYFCTPRNSITFATTGGDGVHFGLMTEDNAEVSDGPVVMTVPMAPKNNVIVAETFAEFLSLGYHVGWSALEELVYDEEEAIAYFSKPDPELDQEEQRFLTIIREELKIELQPLSTNRLAELHNRYFHRLVIDEFKGIDYALLTPEQRKLVEDFLNEEPEKDTR